MSSPYQPPAGMPDPSLLPADAPIDADREKLRAIARGQRHVFVATAAQIGIHLWPSATRWLHLTHPAFYVAGGLISSAIFIFTIASVYRLAKALHGGGTAILYALGMLLPCVNLCLVVVLGAQARTRLKDAGLEVGLLGIHPDAIK